MPWVWRLGFGGSSCLDDREIPLDDRLNSASEWGEVASLPSHCVLLRIAEPLDGVECAFILGRALA